MSIRFILFQHLQPEYLLKILFAKFIYQLMGTFNEHGFSFCQSMQPEYLIKNLLKYPSSKLNINRKRTLYMSIRFSLCTHCNLNISSKICSKIFLQNYISTERRFFMSIYSVLCNLCILNIFSKLSAQISLPANYISTEGDHFYEHRFSTFYSLCILNICSNICSNVFPPNYISTEGDLLCAQFLSLQTL